MWLLGSWQGPASAAGLPSVLEWVYPDITQIIIQLLNVANCVI